MLENNEVIASKTVLAAGGNVGSNQDKTNSPSVTSNTLSSFSSADYLLPPGCIEPEAFWALSRPARTEYRGKLRTLLGSVPKPLAFPSPDDCLLMAEARKMRESGRDPGSNFLITYPKAADGATFRQNQRQEQVSKPAK